MNLDPKYVPVIVANDRHVPKQDRVLRKTYKGKVYNGRTDVTIDELVADGAFGFTVDPDGDLPLLRFRLPGVSLNLWFTPNEAGSPKGWIF